MQYFYKKVRIFVYLSFRVVLFLISVILNIRNCKNNYKINNNTQKGWGVL